MFCGMEQLKFSYFEFPKRFDGFVCNGLQAFCILFPIHSSAQTHQNVLASGFPKSLWKFEQVLHLGLVPINTLFRFFIVGQKTFFAII